MFKDIVNMQRDDEAGSQDQNDGMVHGTHHGHSRVRSGCISFDRLRSVEFLREQRSKCLMC